MPIDDVDELVIEHFANELMIACFFE